MGYELSNEDLDKIPSVLSNDFEADSVKMYKGIKSLKKVLASLKLAMMKKKAILKTQIKKMLDVLGLSSFENNCVNKMWINLFCQYLNILDFENLYTIQLMAYQCETLKPNKRGKPLESKITRPELLLSIDRSDLQK